MKTKSIIFIYLIHLAFINNLFSQDAVFPISVTVDNKEISGEYSVWYGEGVNDGVIMKPFVICEGFDPLGDQDAFVVRNQINNNWNFVQELVNDHNYDVVILDLDKNTMEIEKNAELFIALINTINTELETNGSINRIDALGVSMGGLIIRYALTKMEHDGTDHRVERYISFDSPHLGANVPLGFQQMLDTSR